MVRPPDPRRSVGICRQQLPDFEKHIAEFEKRNIQVIAASADSWEHALQTVHQYRLTCTIGYRLGPCRVSALPGAFYSERDNYLHATGFIIDPEGRIEDAVYSIRQIGRLVAKDCIDFIGR